MAKSNKSERLIRQIQAWRDDLIDLSRRNRLINMALTGRTSALEIKQPDHNEILVALAEGLKWRFHYPPIDPLEEGIDDAMLSALEAENPDLDELVRFDELITNAPSASKLSTRLRTMSTRAAAEYLDKGLRVLYLTVGMLKWQDGEGNDLLSPLVLIPVVLDRGTPRDPYWLSEAEEDWAVNPALRVKLEQEFEIVLPDLLDGMDVDEFLEEVDSLVESEGWAVTRQVALSPLSFAKETMYQDLKDNEEIIAAHPLIEALALGDVARDGQFIDRIPDDELDEKFPPEQLFSILDADSTQRQCVIAAKRGSSFVMDGPPGSGKSQTIANVIAELMAAGKSILFVSEKAAALEVVKKRLDSAHLGEFVLELHSHNATRREVAAALGGSVLKRVGVPRQAEFSTRTLASRRSKLSDYAVAMNERHISLEMSLHEAIGRCGELGDSPLAPSSDYAAGQMTREGFEAILERARELSNSWGPVSRGEDFLWREISEFGLSRSIASIEAELDEITRNAVGAKERGQFFASLLSFEQPADIAGISRLGDLSEAIGDRPEIEWFWLSSRSLHETAALVTKLKDLSSERLVLVETISLKSDNWETLPIDTSLFDAAMEKAQNSVDSMEFGTMIPDAIEDQIGLLRDAAASLQQIESKVVEISRTIGIKLDVPTFEDIARVLELVSLANVTDRPERSWIDAQIVVKARDAIQKLRPLLAEWKTLRAQVDEVFNENIELFDFEMLFDGPLDFEPKIKRLSGRGRSNRKQLVAISRDGKITPRLTAALPVARAWQSLSSKLAELDEGVVLGAYYSGPSTDLTQIEAAVDAAETALRLAGSGADLKQLSSQIARDAIDVDGLQSMGTHLEQFLGSWNSTRLSLVQLGDWLAGHDTIRKAADSAGAAASALVELVGVASTYASKSVETVTDLYATAVQRQRIAEIESEFETVDSALLGRMYDGWESNWDALIAGISWCERVRGVASQDLDDRSAKAFAEVVRDNALEAHVAELKRSCDVIVSLFEGDQRGVIFSDLNGNLEDLTEVVAYLRSSTSDIGEWRSHHSAISDLTGMGVQQIVDFALREELPANELADLFERTLLRSWVDHVMTSDERLSPPMSKDRDSIAAEFRDLDAKLAASAAAKVIEICNGRRPTNLVGEPAILKTESEKKRKHRPVRDLLAQTAQTSQDVKPCFMMSPLAVSQFLPPGMRFDVVIFDEASQVRPCDAINSIYRGDQLIVAGDEKQLPPTSFFERSISDSDDSYDEEDTVEFESVLKLAKGAAGVDELPLRWHYRSRHESLITPSNRMFYNSELVTYPGAIDVSDEYGVELIHVPDAVYARGGARDNPIEAVKVVERILHFARNFPGLTVGVVAFSEAQASRINYELEAQRRDHPQLDGYFAGDRLDGFFVKNLESVQGDERDVIIFSIGYGRDENGAVAMNFGPLNREGGKRRLNVAITRARQRVEVVSSITAADFERNSTNEGVRSLRRYLDFAENGISAFADDLGEGGEPESPFEEEVLSAVREMGFDVTPQVGQAGYRIDMAVKHPERPGRYVLGIECDGAQYHSSRVARDRDRLRQEVLEGLGWTLHRIWGTSWYRNKEVEKVRLRQAIENALTGKPSSKKSRRAPTAAAPELVEVDEAPLGDWAGEFRWNPLTVKRLVDYDDPQVSVQLVDVVERIIKSLEPVHPETVLVMVREIWSVNRMSAQRRDRFDQAVNSLLRQDRVTRDRFGFLWGNKAMEFVVRVPTDDEKTFRRVAHVSPDEIKLAMFYLAKDARSLATDVLYSRTAKLFHWKMVDETRLAFDRAFSELITSDSLILEPNLAGETVVRPSDDEFPDLS